MKSNNVTDLAMLRALEAQLSSLLPDAEGWQANVLAEMDRRKRRKLRWRRLSVASLSTAAAAALLLVATGREPEPDAEYIYSSAYYAAMPAPQHSVAEEISLRFAEAELPPLSDYYEPYTPLPQ